MIALMRHHLALLLTVLALAQPAHASSAATIVGHWYGEGWQPNLHQDAQWLDDFRPDGTYTMITRISQDCRTSDTLTNAGIWSYAGGVLSMTIQNINGAQLAPEEFIHDTYQMQSMTQDAMAFLHDQSGGTRFAVRRVSATFQLPTCLTS
jgi:hypothetical protein